jgi:[amino group carrier protein]-6-phospho-L-2-aminoadipate/5-phospho-L-glutamate reductase
MKMKKRVAILGASGFTGGELLRLLLSHPGVEVVFASSEREAGQRVQEALVGLRHVSATKSLRLSRLSEMPEVDVAFACLPQGALPQHLGFIEQRAELIINLAGDYRLRKAEEISLHYPESQAFPWPERHAYFVPELSPSRPRSGVVSLPGCMAAATIYALYPLCKMGLIDKRVVADVKTGSSGSGKAGSEHSAERAGNFRPHKLHGHRHRPEIVQALADYSGQDMELQFSTHSLDLPRGILATVYTRLEPGVTPLDVKRAFSRAYLHTAFVRHLNRWMPMIKAVLGSNWAELNHSVEGQSCVVVCALDNLIKGAAGQAVQAFNLIHEMDESAALSGGGVWP